MRTKIRNILQIIGIFLLASCNREEITGGKELPSGDKIAVATEITVDGVELSTRAATEAGYTTGDGLYDKGDQVTVAAFANDGYELVTFYDKKYPATDLGSSYPFTVSIPRIFKAEFRAVANYTVSVSASPSAGGSVTGGGSYKGGTSCTVTATPNSGYVLDGWYEGSSKVSSDASYTFTVSSNRTLIAKFYQGVYYFSSSNESYGSVSLNIAIIEDWRNLEYGEEICVTPEAKSGYKFSDWGYKLPNSTSWERVPAYYVNSSNQLYLDNSQIVDIFPSGTDFIANFYDPSPSGETDKGYTVTINAAEWTGSNWLTLNRTLYGLSFGSATISNLGTIRISRQFKAGEICTVGIYTISDGNGTCETRYITDASHDINKQFVAQSSYSFTVTGNTEYYIDIQYIRD